MENRKYFERCKAINCNIKAYSLKFPAVLSENLIDSDRMI